MVALYADVEGTESVGAAPLVEGAARGIAVVDVVVGCRCRCSRRRVVREESDGDASRQSWRLSMPKSMQSEPSRTRCSPSFARTRCTSGMKAFSGFTRTENA